MGIWMLVPALPIFSLLSVAIPSKIRIIPLMLFCMALMGLIFLIIPSMPATMSAVANDYRLNILNHLRLSAIPPARFLINERQPHQREYLVRISNGHEDIYDAVARRDPEAAREQFEITLQ